MKKVIQDSGKFLGAAFKIIGDYMTQGVEFAGEYINKKIEEPADKKEVDPATKQKWEQLKRGTETVITVSK